MDVKKIDQHLYAVLRAAGSALRHYSLPKSLDDMRAAMKAAIDDATSDLQARVAELEAERAERAAQKPVAWEGAEQWEPLAMFLCADENGSDSCHEMVWEGWPPEPWGERWQKYESEARRMIDLTSYAFQPVTAPVRLTDEQIEKVDEAICEALGSAYDCARAWSAWGVGTMGPGDFWPVADSDDRVAEIRNAAAAALGFEVGT